MKNKNVIYFIIITLALALIFYFVSENQKKVIVKKYDKVIEQMNQENKNLKQDIEKYKAREDDMLVVNMSEDEQNIRKYSKMFVRSLYEMKKNESFNSKETLVRDYITDDLNEKLFNHKDKYNLLSDMTVDNLHVYFDEYKKGKNKYYVLVRFDQKFNHKDLNDKKDITTELEFVRNNEQWLISSFDVFE
ncbi:hypothetical protein [Macrococcus armenti]|uniref:hypothetical protein n=1 Tax=Macrococcus armenti TaxID=2875764 RepID=UPI001CCAF6B4|nr:hypothetical protein [Macrococcus armenti]UBH13600.1 hypothetical protein LAU43_02605 [Macrococcus armenti]